MSAFKEEISPALVERLHRDLGLDDSFLEIRNSLSPLELKDRVRLVADTLRECLPADWNAALAALSTYEGVELPSLTGWPIQRVLEDHGLHAPEASLDAIRRLTATFSGEFAVRPYLRQDPVGALATMRGWTASESEHVRRLASEGCRPRLPWGGHLKAYIADPTPVLALLEDLKDDPSEYVRRSVANNLNDIAKDHPDRVVEVAARWMQGADRNRERLVKHALRHLIKAGDVGALAVIGVLAPKLDRVVFTASSPVAVGQPVDLVLELDVAEPQKLVIDYRMHFVGKKRMRKKVFKWSTRQASGPLRLEKAHPMVEVSIRKLYVGEHRVELLVNGQVVAEDRFELTAP